MNKDRILGLVVIVVGLIGIALTAQVPSTTFTDDPGPRVFPYMASGIMVLCGFGMIFVRKPAAAGAEDEGDEMSLSGWLRTGTMLAVFAVYGILLWLIGFHVATPVMTLVIYALIAGREKFRLVPGLIYSVATYLCLYLLFVQVLNSYLPQGIVF